MEDPDAIELRVLGCLVEKQRTTPDGYPLTLNALRLAANQSTNRDPVTDYDEETVRAAAQRLGRRGWVRFASGAGSRTAKYRQIFNEALDLGGGEIALLAVLMLRGEQTPGELHQRAARLHAFGGLGELIEVLERLATRGLVERLGRRAGQKEDRYRQLIGGAEPDPAEPALASEAPDPARFAAGSGAWVPITQVGHAPPDEPAPHTTASTTEPSAQSPPSTDLTDQQEHLCADSRWDFSDLRALYINCTLKRSPEPSNTEGLARRSIAIMERLGVAVDTIRAVDLDIATGVYPDMTEHGWERDDWPAIHEQVMAADILVLLTPIWLGEKSSVATQVIERLYGNSHLLNDAGQYAYYGRVGGTIVTGNEDGAKHCAMNVLYSLQHLGYTIPPQADSGWLGEAGPGPSYLDPGSGGPENDFTNRSTTFLTWNLLHVARMLKDAGGIPAHGNQRSAWDAGCRHDYANPEHR